MIGEGKYPEVICEELLGYCLAPVCQMGGLGGDNMSIIIICMLHGKPWEDLVEKCKRIHADKKASSKLSEPVFSQFDRFTADGPFAEVSVLKAADDGHNATDSNSSSSHTSSPSSSPISIDEKFDNLLAEGSEGAQKSEIKSAGESSEEAAKVEIEAVVVTEAPAEGETAESNTTTQESAPASDAPKDPIVSNGE
jgi:hypothetical protein